jgi:hypothetical protein
MPRCRSGILPLDKPVAERDGLRNDFRATFEVICPGVCAKAGDRLNASGVGQLADLARGSRHYVRAAGVGVRIRHVFRDRDRQSASWPPNAF